MFTARYGLSAYIKQTGLVFKGLNVCMACFCRQITTLFSIVTKI